MLTPKAFVKMGLDMGDSRFTAAKSIGQPLGDEGSLVSLALQETTGPPVPSTSSSKYGQLPMLLLCLATDMDFKGKASTLGRVRGQAPGPTKGTEAGRILIPENKSQGITGGSTVREEAVRIWAVIARSSIEVSINLLLQQEGVANTHFTWAIQEGSATSSTAHTTNRHAMHMGKQNLMQQESMIHAQCPLSLSANGDNSPWTHQGVLNSTASINDQAIAHHI